MSLVVNGGNDCPVDAVDADDPADATDAEEEGAAGSKLGFESNWVAIPKLARLPLELSEEGNDPPLPPAAPLPPLLGGEFWIFNPDEP